MNESDVFGHLWSIMWRSSVETAKEMKLNHHLNVAYKIYNQNQLTLQGTVWGLPILLPQ